MSRVWPLASNEDGVDWFDAREVGRVRARLAGARLVGEPLWLLDVLRLTVNRESMRPAVCPVHPPDHAQPYDLDPPDTCECAYVDEGWHYLCPSDHPDAVPVWRVEWVRELPAAIDALRMRISRRRWTRRPALWGARRLRDQLRLAKRP